jgi:hypothetical protein
MLPKPRRPHEKRIVPLTRATYSIAEFCDKTSTEQRSCGMDVLHKAEPAWRAAQVQVKDLLGKAAFIAVTDLASRIMDPIA